MLEVDFELRLRAMMAAVQKWFLYAEIINSDLIHLFHSTIAIG
jgi:hypothetical protein